MKKSPYKKHSIYQQGVVIFFKKQLGIPVSTLHTAEKTLMLLRNTQINVDTPPLPPKKQVEQDTSFFYLSKYTAHSVQNFPKTQEFHK
jgi:hypothetical protein